jgi:phenylpropionate dioxygenase-like ring-hydroxylating dioxygenase large terminal subunit
VNTGTTAGAIRSYLEEAGPGLEADYTLPADWYTDPAIFEAERIAIFGPSWQYVGPLEHVKEVGGYFTATIAGTPVVVVRGRDGELRAHINICRHRGHEVMQGRGTARALRCPYHAWTYGLDGGLRSAPRSRDDEAFQKCDWSLLPAAVTTWGPMVFVNLDADAEPPDTSLRLLGEGLSSAGLAISDLRFRKRTQFDMAANWKITMENYVECYHCAPTHPEFCEIVSTAPGVLKTEVLNETLLSLVSPLLPGVREKGGQPYGLEGEVHEGQFHALFPTSTFSMYPGRGNLQVGAWLGLDAGHTRKFTDWFFAEKMTDEAMDEMTKFIVLVAEQDTGIVESVQRGWASGRVRAGRVLAVEQEETTRQFQRLVFDALASRVAASPGRS